MKPKARRRIQRGIGIAMYAVPALTVLSAFAYYSPPGTLRALAIIVAVTTAIVGYVAAADRLIRGRW